MLPTHLMLPLPPQSLAPHGPYEMYCTAAKQVIANVVTARVCVKEVNSKQPLTGQDKTICKFSASPAFPS